MSGWERRPTPHRTPANPYHPDNDPDLRPQQQRPVSVASSGVSSMHGDDGPAGSVDLTTPTSPQGGWANLHIAPPQAPPAASYNSSTHTQCQHEYMQQPIAQQSFAGAPYQQLHPHHPPPQGYQPAAPQHPQHGYVHQQEPIWRPSPVPQHHQPPIHHLPPSAELPPSSRQSSGTSSSRRRRALDGVKRGLRRVKSGLSISSQSEEERREANNPYTVGNRDGPSTRSRFLASTSRIFGQRRDGSASPPPVPAIPAEHLHHQSRMHTGHAAEVSIMPSPVANLPPPSAVWTLNDVTHSGRTNPEGRPMRRVDSNEDFHRRRMAESRRNTEHSDATAAMLDSLQTENARREARHQLHQREQEALDSLNRRRQ
ncbi:hypothetical protein BCR35DRAFT_332558 [Leucosporidium creatinivorum]|uniref:Uncharacterized protein n=1 Tax=Leucosporidium creatinivorum TaxID=106004 RepID=A0A1Y2F2C8_9BASI|nr:hypothetical protein BCR35DRAFT_332558 [Leucosporidium creatinivorum]